MSIPNLWLRPARRTQLATLSDPGPDTPPALAALVEALRLDTPPRPETHHSSHDNAVRLALRAAVAGDRALAARALADWRAGLVGLARLEDLGKAHLALASAILFDLAAPLWTPAELERWRSDSLTLADSFFQLSPGNPHHVVNNWWAVTHSGLYCLASALHLSGCTATPTRAARPVPELAEWAWTRVDAFLGHFGEAGAYHEGLGYQGYTCSYVLPAALLRQHLTGRDLAPRFPGLRSLAELLLLAALEGPALDFTTGQRGGWGRQLSWNDAGLDWPDNAVALLALAWAPPEKLPALLARWDRLSGHLRPGRRLPARFGALFFVAAFHPGELPAAPEPVCADLALSLCDRKQGLWFSRDAHAGPADAVLGGYARCQHPGGHVQDDAGSFRFSALGWDWVLGGGQARPEALWQSVVVSSDPPQKPVPCGSVQHVEDRVFGMELRRVRAAYAERWLALHPATADAPLAVALLDLIDDHRHDRDWTWRLTTSPEHAFAPSGDGLGFTLTAPDGARLEAHFLGEAPLSLGLEQSPGSARTFVHGHHQTYRGRPCVVARFPRRPALAIYVVFTLQGAAPGPSAPLAAPTLIPGAGLDLAWCDTESAAGRPAACWHRPFGLAFPAGVPLARLRSQSAHPAPLSS